MFTSKNLTAIVALAMAFGFCLTAQGQEPWWVAPEVNPQCEDGSYNCPFDTIQEAFDAAELLDPTRTEVALRHGEFNNVFLGPGNRNIVWGTIVKLLRPEEEEGFVPVIDCQELGRAFIFDAGQGPDTVIDGIKIINGRADYGAAIRIHNSSPTIRNCVIKDCDATIRGGEIDCETGSAQILGCTISDNVSASDGGGVSFVGGSHYQPFPSLSLENCVIAGNRAEDGRGGGIFADMEFLCFGTMSCVACEIVDNVSGSGNDGGGAFVSGCDMVFENCVLSRNTASGGGGGLCFGGEAGPYNVQYLVNCTFLGNTAGGNGGAISAHGSPLLVNCLVAGNLAKNQGIAIHGGGLYYNGSGCCSCFPTIKDSTFAHNWADGTSETGGGAYFQTHANSPGAEVANSIFWGNAPDQLFDAGSGDDPDVQFSDIQDGWSGDGNIALGPLFRATGQWNEGEWSPGEWSSGLYQVSCGSPCINAGNDDLLPPDVTDLDRDDDSSEALPLDRLNRERTIGTVDMGSFEYQDCPFDFDANCVVNPIDSGLVQSHFGCDVQLPECARFDVDHNGVVNPIDSGLVMGGFGNCP